jgi:hypothetical protein
MKHIKKYQLFIEEVGFPIATTDSPDVKFAKDSMNTIQLNLNDYKTKKPLVDKLYAEVTDPVQIENKLKEIFGKTDIQSGKDRNPFLVEYVHVVKLKADIELMKQQNVYDKATIDDFNQEMSDLATNNTNDPNQKQVISEKIAEINKRMNDRVVSLAKIQADFTKSLKEHTDKMSKMGTNIGEYIKKISNVN